MKQRITYLVQNPDDFTPEQLDVSETTFTLNKVPAAKEHRITFGLSELPGELRTAFEQWHELHIRWTCQTPYTAVPPFTSRVSPGLHVFFTPRKDQPETTLCDHLHQAFGPLPKCSSPTTSFTKLPVLSERFSMSSYFQYYAHVPTLENLVTFIHEKLCNSSSKACKAAASSLLSVAYLDIDYDAISHAVVINAFWAPNTWTESVTLPGKQDTIEIGVLTHEPNPDPDDIGFGGFLTVLGQDTAPKPTRFQTPTRHYPLAHPLTYTTSLSSPTGLHPTLIISLSTLPIPPHATCKLHAHLTLPSALFIDKYQFVDPLFLAAHHLHALRSLSGATDLEAPDWVVEQWGSAALFEVALPNAPNQQAPPAAYNISIPLHLRYLPAAPSSHSAVPLPWPVLFFACRADEGAKMAGNPFDRLHLGYEALFGPKTRFMHVPPAQGVDGMVEWIDVPVLDLRGAAWVEWGTVGMVVGAFLGLCWVLFGGKKEVVVEKGGKKKQ